MDTLLASGGAILHHLSIISLLAVNSISNSLNQWRLEEFVYKAPSAAKQSGCLSDA